MIFGVAVNSSVKRVVYISDGGYDAKRKTRPFQYLASLNFSVGNSADYADIGIRKIADNFKLFISQGRSDYFEAGRANVMQNRNNAPEEHERIAGG